MDLSRFHGGVMKCSRTGQFVAFFIPCNPKLGPLLCACYPTKEQAQHSLLSFTDSINGLLEVPENVAFYGSKQ